MEKDATVVISAKKANRYSSKENMTMNKPHLLGSTGI